VPDLDVSAVIVNWNAGPALARCVASLEEHGRAVRMEIVVVDNASTDRSVEGAADVCPDVRIVANPTNRGLAAANNQGIVATSGRYVLIANPDVEFGPGAVDALVDLLDRRPRAAIAVARLRRPDGTIQTGAGDLPTLAEALLGRQAARRRRATTGFWWDGWAHDEERTIGHGMEACYLVRRAALTDIGLQDERFPLDWEGIDWSATAWATGWEVWFCPAAEVVHLGGVSLRQAQRAWIVRSHRGMYRYFAKRSPAWAKPLLGAAVAVRAGAKLVAARAGLADYDAGHPDAAA
jgi:GT2 family glycosyltransferase